MTEDMQGMIEGLQVLVMEQQRAVETVSEQVILAAKRMDKLELRFDELEKKLAAMLDSLPPAQRWQDECPPHY